MFSSILFTTDHDQQIDIWRECMDEEGREGGRDGEGKGSTSLRSWSSER